MSVLPELMTGWYGIPGGPESRSTKVHAVVKQTLKPFCGARLRDDQRFQFNCATVHYGWIECGNCFRMLP